jgi:hypothetical protein
VGSGEALVSGRVDPDEFVIAKATSEIRWRRIGEKGTDQAIDAALTDDQVRELTALVLEVERHYGAPQDVEWCYDGARFWIVQSRPVTTAVAAVDEIEWTRANLAEVLPDLTSPQALDAFEKLLETARAAVSRVACRTGGTARSIREDVLRSDVLQPVPAATRRAESRRPPGDDVEVDGACGVHHPDDENRASARPFVRCARC